MSYVVKTVATFFYDHYQRHRGVSLQGLENRNQRDAPNHRRSTNQSPHIAAMH